MLDSLWDWLYPRRSSSDREKAIFLVLMLAALLFFAPLFDCPCGGRPKFAAVGTPTDDRFEFAMKSCRACRGSGRLSPFDRCFGEAPRRD